MNNVMSDDDILGTQELKTFHVYYGKNEEIIGISEKELKDHGALGYIKVKFSDVKDFLSGEKPISRYLVKVDDIMPSKGKIVKKGLNINFLRTLDKFLVEIPEKRLKNSHLLITRKLKSNTLSITISANLRMDILDGREYAAHDINIKGLKHIIFYICSENDPSFLFESVVIPLNELLNKRTVTKDIKFNPRNISIYTKKIFNKYSYEVIDD